SGFQHLFTDIPPLLRVRIDSQLNHELIQQLNNNILGINYNNDREKIQMKIQTITEFLSELKTIEDNLQQQSTQPLVQTCGYLAIDNPILSWIPDKIKCENYVELYIHLIRARSKLQEQKLNIEEQKMKLWEENSNFEDQQGIRLHQYINPQYDRQISNDLENKDIQSTPLMTIHLRAVPCLSSVFSQQIHKYREEAMALEPIIVAKPQKYFITHPNGESKPVLWKREAICEQFRKLFDVKKYNYDSLVVVDKNEMVFDFTKDNYRLSDPSIFEYHIIEKQLLIQTQIHFRAQIYEYLTTSKCTMSTIIRQFIDSEQLRSLSSASILCFVDQYGKCFVDETINNFCTEESKTISIFVTEETLDGNALHELACQYKKDEIPMIDLFSSTAKWQQIKFWLKTIIDPSVDDYVFFMREKEIIIDDNRILSTTTTESMIIDVINRNSLSKVILTFETNNQTVDVLKSMKISSLLNLMGISSDDCVLVLTGENKLKLTEDDLEKSVSTYSSNENDVLHLQLLISIQITKYDDKENINIPLSNRNITIEQLLNLTEKSIDVYKYLATNDTKKIINSNEKLSNLNQTKFILVQENETCLVSIMKSSNNLQQRFVVFATLADVYKENILHQYLMYSTDFVPSKDIQLLSFTSESPIQFIAIDENLPITVTVQNDEVNKSIQFNCELSITVERLYAIACQLFSLNNEYYRLTMEDVESIDGDVSLKDIDENMSEISFKIVSIASQYCSIKYLNQIIRLPCCGDTSVMTIVKEVLQKLDKPADNIKAYDLIALDEDQTEIDFDYVIDDVIGLFPNGTTTISLELKKKND
ncbi:unnamed protein product, partial [Rotaria magnacalcarata]